MVDLASSVSSARRHLDFGPLRDRASEAEKFGAHRDGCGAAARALIMPDDSIDKRVERLQEGGVIDMHFDLPMDLYEKRAQSNVLSKEFVPEFEAGGMGLIGAALYIEDRYLPEQGLQVALDQISRLYTEAEQSRRCVVCRTKQEISVALEAKRIGFVITMEGVEPLGGDLDLLRAFYELGVRMIGLTHARTNAAGHGGIFAASGSSPQGLTPFGRHLVRECERLGVIVDLAHCNPAGVKDIGDLTAKP